MVINNDGTDSRSNHGMMDKHVLQLIALSKTITGEQVKEGLDSELPRHCIVRQVPATLCDGVI